MSETVSQTWEDWVHERGVAQGITQGEIAACRQNLLTVLEKRFGKVPARLVKKVRGTTDLPKLKSAFHQALSIKAIDELSL